MTCRKCGSNNVNVTMLSEIRRKKKGFLYWLLIGIWLEPILWIFLTLPMLIFKIFKPSKYKSKVTKHTVCQNCGHSWRV